MASSSSPPVSETDGESQPKTCLMEGPLSPEEFRRRILSKDPIPNFDWKAIPPAGPERKFDVAQRVEELRKYLRESTYPRHEKNIRAIIEMYNLKELPRKGAHRVYVQEGKLVSNTVDNILRPEPIWIEVCLRL